MKRLSLLALGITLMFSVRAQDPGYLVKQNIPYYESGNASQCVTCVLDIYYPEREQKFATIIWFHGGGLTDGSKELPEQLKNKNIAIVGVEYRLHPHVTSPRYIEDAAAAVAWVFQNISKFGGDPSLIFISGHSAGAYLATLVALDPQWLQQHQINSNQIAGVISLSGQMITHFTIRKERGIKDTQPIVDSFAPLFHVKENAPPLLLVTGDRSLELLGRYEENAYMWRMMKIAGHQQTKLFELQGYGHDMTAPAFPLLLDEVRRVIEAKRTIQNK